MNAGKRKRSSLWVFAMLMVLATGVAAGGLHQLNQAAKDADGGAAQATAAQSGAGDVAQARSVALEGERITLRPVQRSVGAVGTFSGYDEVTVAAEVSGRVAKVFHDVGDILKPGDPLMELDTTDYALELEQTRRALELEVVRLGVEAPPEPPTLDEIASLLRTFDVKSLPSVVRAAKMEEIARLRLNRAEELLEGKAMSEEDAQQRRTEYDVAKAAADQANYDAQAALAAIRHRAVLLRIAMRKLDLTTVRVPTPTLREFMPDDVRYAVVERKATEGEMLKDAPGTSTATFDLVMDGVLKLEARVPERFTADVKQGQEVQIRVDAYADRVFHGQVMRINPAVDRTSRTFLVQVYVPNPERELKAGGFAEVEILTRVDPEAWTVSPESVVTSVGSTRVFVARDGKAHVVPVERGVDGAGWVELLRPAGSDLQASDIIIRGGQDKLAEGVPVSIRNEAELKTNNAQQVERTADQSSAAR